MWLNIYIERYPSSVNVNSAICDSDRQAVEKLW